MSFKSNGYKSIEMKAVPDWAKKSDREPILDQEAVAYGWIVKANPKDMGITSVMITGDEGGEIIDQAAMGQVKQIAIDKLIAFYNKFGSDSNREVIRSNTTVKDIRVPTRPKSPVLFYVIVDARAFDNISEVGQYSLQIVAEGSTLHSLAEEYKGFFKINDSTQLGHRSRIAEILRANSIDIEVADEKMIKEWIATTNGDLKRDVSFASGAKIYLPQISMPEPPAPAFIVSLEIGEIVPTVAKANANLEYYKKKIDNFKAAFGGKVEYLDLKRQIELLKEFYPSLRSHIEFNDIQTSTVLHNEIEIFLNEDYEIIYMALNNAGEKIPLLKGMITLSSIAPFNDLRTMALISSIEEISRIGANKVLGVGSADIFAPKMPWEEFVKKYIVPPVEITNLETNKLFDQLLETNSVIAQLVTRFNKSGYKTQEDIEKENEALSDPNIIATAVNQEEKVSDFNGDVIISNLAKISRNIARAGKSHGADVIDVTYTELLNRIDISTLVKTAIDCLSKLLSCREIVEGMLGKNLMLGYGTFKVKLPPEVSYLADRALQVAQSGDFGLFGGVYSSLDIPKNNTPGLKFMAVLEMAIREETTINFDHILDEVCASLASPPESLSKAFKIPMMLFPDDLPVVDLQSAIVAMLEAAIIELLVGLVVGLVQSILDELLAFCKEDLETTPFDADYGSSDLLVSVSNKVGEENLSDILSDLFDSLGVKPVVAGDAAGSHLPGDLFWNTVGTCTLPDGTVTDLKKSDCMAAGGSWTVDDPESSFMDQGADFSAEDVKKDLRKDVAAKCSLIRKLLNDLSVILTPAEISSLFNSTASTAVLDTIIDVIQVRHAELYPKVHTREQVSDLFSKIEKIADVGTILSQITTISRGLGCTFESKCIRDDLRTTNMPGPWPDDGTKKRITDLLDPTLTDLESPSTFCEEKGSNVDLGLIPKDNASLLFVLKKVIGVMYDGIYMAYDAEISRIPDAMDIIQERPKLVPRTTKQGVSINVDTFNFFKMQEETFTVEFPEWLPKKTVIHPEFQRLLGTGYVPPDGDPQGMFGPYTTEKVPGFLGIEYDSPPLDPIIVPEKFAIFAGNSKAGLKQINKLKIVSDSGPDGLARMAFTLTEPFKGQGFKPSTFALKFSLNAAKDSNDYRNPFLLQIGDIPVDPSTIPVGDIKPGQITPAISYGPLESAIYRSRLSGVTSVDSDVERIINFLQDKRGNNLITPGSIPQMDILSGFVDVVVDTGVVNSSLPVLESEATEGAISSRLGGGTSLESPALQTATALDAHLKDFVYKKMYGNLLLQMISGIGSEILGTPMLKKTKSDKTPYIRIVDWAPIPTDDQIDCDFDPHILALDTVKKRTREAYEQYIKCSPLEEEISVDGLGRPNLSALEAAGMTGCIMTTIRAYALEQLLRAMYPVSVFAGKEFITKLMVEYIIEETLRGIKKVGPAYYEAFLEQVEVIFALRMKEFNPFGSVPDIIAQSSDLGIDWMYADAAIREFGGAPSGEEVKVEELDAVHAGTEGNCDTPATDGEVATKSSVKSSKEQRVRSRIRFLAEEQLYSLMPKLQDLICLNGTLTFDNNFLNRRLPLFDIQREKGEMRLSKVHESLRTMEEEELLKQYGEYLKEFEDWEGTRLSNLIQGGMQSILDVADTVGTSMTCLTHALANPIMEIEVPDVIGAVEDLDLDITDIGGSIESVGGAVQEVVGELGSSVGTAIGSALEGLGGCVDMAVGGGALDENIPLVGGHETPGVVGAAKKALDIITDSPPPLEQFGVGLEEGATDRIGNLDTFMRGEYKGEFFLTDDDGSLILEKYVRVKKKGYVAPPTAQYGTADPSAPTYSAQSLQAQGPQSSADVPTSTSSPGPTNTPGASSPNQPSFAGKDFQGSGNSSGQPAIDCCLPSTGAPGSALADAALVAAAAAVGASSDTNPVGSFTGGPKTDLSISQALCPREVVDTSTRTETVFGEADNTPEEEALVGPQPQISLIPQINPDFEQIYNIEEWEDIAKSLQQGTSFGDLYESWSFGVRIVYVAPTNDFEEVPDNSEIGVAPPTLKIPNKAGTAPNPVRLLFDEGIIDSSRSYRQFERMEVERKEVALDYQYPGAIAAAQNFLPDAVISGPERIALDAAMGEIKTHETEGGAVGAGESISSLGKALTPGGGFQVTPFPARDNPLNTRQIGDQISQAQAFKKVLVERALTIFPLVEVEIPINIDKNTDISQVLSSIRVGANKKNKSLDELWKRRFMNKLMNRLKDSPGYKMIFKYCTPSHTLLSFASIYSNLLNEMPETFFDGTKSELKTLFEILLNGGDYTFENEKEKKRGGNREQMAHAQGNMGTDGSARKPGLFDLAVQTPKLIFKGLAEFLDPVIAPAAVIVKAGKTGKLLPKFMKKIDAEGNETEENYLLEVTLGPYDLPPPMGKFNIPFPGSEPTKEGLSENPSENFTFELPIFDFKDVITGESLSPFLREKVFALKNGNAEERQLYYEFSKGVATFNIITVVQIVTKIYVEAMDSGDCADSMIKANGVPIVPIPTLVYPGEKLDLPITPVALSVIPMDILSGYGPGPPHTPLGHIYHAIVAAEGLQFPDLDTKARQRANAGIENKKKKPKEKLCIDIDLIREEEDRRRG